MSGVPCGELADYLARIPRNRAGAVIPASPGTKYTEWEDRLIMALWPLFGLRELSKLLGRAPGSVYQRHWQLEQRKEDE